MHLFVTCATVGICSFLQSVLRYKYFNFGYQSSAHSVFTWSRLWVSVLVLRSQKFCGQRFVRRCSDCLCLSVRNAVRREKQHCSESRGYRVACGTVMIGICECVRAWSNEKSNNVFETTNLYGANCSVCSLCWQLQEQNVWTRCNSDVVSQLSAVLWTCVCLAVCCTVLYSSAQGGHMMIGTKVQSWRQLVTMGGILTHWRRGHLNCLNARSRGF
jgi:hypothetical protein